MTSTTVAFAGVSVDLIIGGPRGERGLTGAPGGTFWNHVQSVASSVWTINHNLGFKPLVDVFSVGGAKVLADVVHVSSNQTQVLFAAPSTGSARLI